MISVIWNRPSVRLGRTSALRPLAVSRPVVQPPSATVVPRPNEGSQPSQTEKIRISTMPTRNVGSATPTSERISSMWLDDAAPVQRGPHAERNAEHRRDQHGAQAELERCRQPLQQQPADRHAEAIGHAEIARQRIAQEAHELQDDRVVEAERAAHRLAVGHARGLPDHVVDRVADVAKQHEADERRRQHDEDRLRQALDEERHHRQRSIGPDRTAASASAADTRIMPNATVSTARSILHLHPFELKAVVVAQMTETPLRTPQASPA